MKTEALTPLFCELIPERRDMKPGTIYVSIEYKTAIHLCACGCGVETVTPFSADGWSMVDGEGLTLTPSILNTRCNAHYFIRDGKIVWA